MVPKEKVQKRWKFGWKRLERNGSVVRVNPESVPDPIRLLSVDARCGFCSRTRSKHATKAKVFQVRKTICTIVVSELSVL
jgi:hypothetical protein